MNDMYQVKLQEFTGPLDKLLELTEARELDVTRISLAAVTVDFLDYVRSLGSQTPPSVLADFLVVAARLVLLKSKVLLPEVSLTEEEECEVHDLESRLTLYREFAARGGAASGHLAAAWGNPLKLHARPFLTGFATGAFYPAENLTVYNLHRGLAVLLETATAAMPQKEESRSTLVSLEAKMAELIARCREMVRQSFHSIAKSHSRSEVVVLFLAVLHLLKSKSIAAEQTEQFGDILVSNLEAEDA
jgi:segregation and condensation protein A